MSQTGLFILTTGRQDWGILRRICRLARNSARLKLHLVAGGMALSPEHGMSVDEMFSDGLPPDEKLDWLASASTGVHVEAAAALRMIGESLERARPDAILIVGDRYETMAAAVAATLARIPIVHLHGGEETEGAFDNALRHSITKLAHLHLVSAEPHAQRVIAMGEDPETVHVVGAPGLDNLDHEVPVPKASLEERLGLELIPPVVVVTLHPATLTDDPAQLARAVTGAMDRVEATYVVTLPNNDPGASTIRIALKAACARPRRVAVESLGKLYWSLMRSADAMLGNSSSALIEAPALGLPAVNVGLRQRRRLRGPNVLDAAVSEENVTQALQRALAPDFRTSIDQGSRALYGPGGASERVLALIETWQIPCPPVKAPIPIEPFRTKA